MPTLDFLVKIVSNSNITGILYTVRVCTGKHVEVEAVFKRIRKADKCVRTSSA